MYLSIAKIAKKYDLSRAFIRKNIKTMKEGIHYIRINKMYRFNEDETHKFLTQDSYVMRVDDDIMNKYLIN